MARTVAIGIQDFATLIKEKYFYIDKTNFIKEWWEGGDATTLITRPRRFGKTLNMSMLDYFFSLEHADKKNLFEGLSIWKEKKYHQLQGTYPVINLTFARVKETTYEDTIEQLENILRSAYTKYYFLKNSVIYKKFVLYWANTSSNSLVGKLLREGNSDIKVIFEALLNGESLKTQMDEQIVYDQLGNNASAIWSLLLASGYLKVQECKTIINGLQREKIYELTITNYETRRMFEHMVLDWFKKVDYAYNGFVKSMLMDDIDLMNI